MAQYWEEMVRMWSVVPIPEVRLTALSPLPLISSYKPESPCAEQAADKFDMTEDDVKDLRKQWDAAGYDHPNLR